MTKAEQRALEFLPSHPNEGIERQRKRFRGFYVDGYEQALQDAIAWLKENANDYIVDLTPTYPDAPQELIVGGMCWEDMKEKLLK